MNEDFFKNENTAVLWCKFTTTKHILPQTSTFIASLFTKARDFDLPRSTLRDEYII